MGRSLHYPLNKERKRREKRNLPPSVSPSPSFELQTAEHLTSTGPSPLLRHRHSVTSTRLIFSLGYERLMEGEVWEGGEREGPDSASGSLLPVHFLLEAAGAALQLLFFFWFYFFQTEVLKGKEASRRAPRPGVSLSLPSPAENPPPIMWATAHTTVTPAATTTARSPSSQQTAALNQIFKMRGSTKKGKAKYLNYLIIFQKDGKSRKRRRRKRRTPTKKQTKFISLPDLA